MFSAVGRLAEPLTQLGSSGLQPHWGTALAQQGARAVVQGLQGAAEGAGLPSTDAAGRAVGQALEQLGASSSLPIPAAQQLVQQAQRAAGQVRDAASSPDQVLAVGKGAWQQLSQRLGSQ